MKWFNLKKNMCPQCNKDFTQSAEFTSTMIICNCGFKISPKRYKEIVTSQVEKNIDEIYTEEVKENGEL